MLILSRREGEVVVVPQCRMEIVVRSIEGDRVRLGFLAPEETAIYRQEIWQEMCFEDFNNRSTHDGNQD